MAIFYLCQEQTACNWYRKREEGEEYGRSEKWHGKVTGAQTKLLDIWKISSTMKQSSLHVTFRYFLNINS